MEYIAGQTIAAIVTVTYGMSLLDCVGDFNSSIVCHRSDHPKVHNRIQL